MTLLINQLDEHNESGIIYLIKNKVEEVLFLFYLFSYAKTSNL